MNKALTTPTTSNLVSSTILSPTLDERWPPEPGPSRPEREPERDWPQPTTPRWEPEPRTPRDWPQDDPSRKTELPGHEPRKPR
jgi:hypothetical protein